MNDSYRTSTECWQKTSSFQKGKNTSTYLSRAKEKRKNIYTKELEPLGGSCEGRKVPPYLETPSWVRIGWSSGNLAGERSNRCMEDKTEFSPEIDGNWYFPA